MTLGLADLLDGFERPCSLPAGGESTESVDTRLQGVNLAKAIDILPALKRRGFQETQC